jgi:hypothetical protein
MLRAGNEADLNYKKRDLQADAARGTLERTSNADNKTKLHDDIVAVERLEEDSK